jgi:hypothetical protein
LGYNNKTTNEHYRYFVNRVQHWIERFGLVEYERSQTHLDTGQRPDLDENVTAAIDVDIEGRVAHFMLCRNWGADPTTKKNLDRAALHEVLHLLISELEDVLIKIRDKREMTKAEHALIRRLENFILGASGLNN